MVRTSLLMLSLLASTAVAQNAAYQWNGRVERQGATVVVQNPDVPLLRPGQLGMQLLWRAPTPADVARLGLWGEASGILATPDVYFVADRRSFAVYRLSANGAWTHTIGKRGNGPGEFSSIGRFAVVNGELRVPVAGKLEVFDAANGSHIRTVRLPDSTRVGFQSPEGTLLNALYRSVRQSPTGQLSPFTFFGDSQPGLARRRAPGECARSAVLEWQQYAYDCYLPRFTVRSEAAVVRHVAIRRDTLVRSAADMAACRRIEAGDIDRATLSAEARFYFDLAVANCRVVRINQMMDVDPVSGLTIMLKQDPRVPADPHASVDIFTTEGVYLASHTFRETWTSFSIHSGNIAALVRDPATGEISVAVYRVTVPPAALEFARGLVRQAPLRGHSALLRHLQESADHNRDRALAPLRPVPRHQPAEQVSRAVPRQVAMRCHAPDASNTPNSSMVPFGNVPRLRPAFALRTETPGAVALTLLSAALIP
jgi:hypothetical protein